MMTEIVKDRRKSLGLSLKGLAEHIRVDASLISKWESGVRMPTLKQLGTLSEVLEVPIIDLKKQWYADKIVELMYDDLDLADEAWTAAEPRLQYLSRKKVLDDPIISEEIAAKLTQIDALKKKWQDLHPLDQNHLHKMESYFRTLYTHDSNQIEGNTLTYQETELVVNQGVTISGKSMKAHLEAINHAEASEFILDLVRSEEDVSRRTLHELHALILRGIDKHNAGKYRSVPVMISGSEHEPPQPYLVEPMMQDYFQHYHKQKSILHPVVLAAEMHERLVSIHPFIDGNGRTARLVMNLILLRNGYTITSLKGDTDARLRYYKALQAVQMHNNPEPFYLLIAERLEASLLEHIRLGGG